MYLDGGYSGEGPGVTGDESDDSEDSGDAETGPGGGGVPLDPEGDPGEGDAEHGGDDGLDEIVAHIALEDESHHQTRVATYKIKNGTIIIV